MSPRCAYARGERRGRAQSAQCNAPFAPCRDKLEKAMAVAESCRTQQTLQMCVALYAPGAKLLKREGSRAKERGYDGEKSKAAAAVSSVCLACRDFGAVWRACEDCVLARATCARGRWRQAGSLGSSARVGRRGGGVVGGFGRCAVWVWCPLFSPMGLVFPFLFLRLLLLGRWLFWLPTPFATSSSFSQ